MCLLFMDMTAFYYKRRLGENMKRNYRYSASGLVFSIFLCMLIAACVGQKHEKRVKPDAFFKKWKAKAETSKGYSPSKRQRVVDFKDKKTAVVGQEATYPAPKELPTQEISMTMHGVDISVLLRTLARAANINIMINQSVQGKADLNIKKAPWDQVFNGILSTHGLTYAWVGDIIRIMTVEDREQDLKRESQKKELKLVEPLMTRIVQIDYAPAGKLQDNLAKFLTVDGQGNPIGSVMVDDHTNSLIIQALADDIDKMVALIQELDRSTFQVLIEAHIVEATKSTARDLGVQWGGLSQVSSGGVNHYITSGANSTGILEQTLVDSSGVAQALNPTTEMAASFPANIGTTGLTLGYVYEDIGKTVLTAQLSALQSEGKLNILSSPSITTLDNQTAVIESGKEVPYQTVEDGEVKIEYKDATLRLEVIPHVINGATLTMIIDVKKDELDFANAVGGQPAITTKKASTKVILLDGETTVIGGLNKEKVDDAESGVPGFKDIPLLGWLFKSQSKDKEMDDLLIFITPHILKERVVTGTKEESPEETPPTEQPAKSDPVPE